MEEGRAAPPSQQTGATSRWARAAAAVALGFVLALSAVAVTDSIRDDAAAGSPTDPPAGVSDAAGELAPRADDVTAEAVQARGCWIVCWRR